MGTSQVVEQLRQGVGADRLGAHLLAEIYHSQVQAEDHQDHPVFDQDAKAQHDTAVSPNVLRKRDLIANRRCCRPKMVGIKKKLDRREATRERKALQAAHLEKSIEKELLERLRSKAYGDAPLNVNEDVWKAVLDADRAKLKGKNKEGEELEIDMEDDESEEEDYEEEEEEEYEGGEREFVEDSGSESDDIEDMEGFSDVRALAGRPSRDLG